mgnify:FL=1
MVYAYRYFYKEKFMSRFICNTLLLTNDDGFDAPGLKILEKVCQRLAKEVWVVAPACDRSGTSQSLSLHTPLRFRQKGVHRYVVEGTPADCVAMAVRHLMIDSPPGFILSGINRGANIGNETIFSGTVGAAMTGVLLGFRAIALSQYFNNRHNIHWDTAEHASEIVLKYLIQGRWDYGTCFNVNLPDVEPDSIKDIAITRQGEGNLNNIGVIVREDLRAIPYAWLNLERSENAEPSDSEGSAVRAGHISVTPLHFDRTHYRDRLIHSH